MGLNMSMDEVLESIANASATKGGNDIRDGRYRLILDRFKAQKGRKDVQIIPEFRVKAAEATEPGVTPNQPGETVRCVWNMSKDATAGNIKALVLALLGLDEGKVSKEDMKKYTAAALSDAQPFRGVEIDCTTRRYENQGKDVPANKGKIMVLPNWSHVPGQTEESVAANCAALGAMRVDVPAAEATPPPPPAPPVAPAASAPPAGGFLAGILGK